MKTTVNLPVPFRGTKFHAIGERRYFTAAYKAWVLEHLADMPKATQVAFLKREGLTRCHTSEWQGNVAKTQADALRSMYDKLKAEHDELRTDHIGLLTSLQKEVHARLRA